MSEGGEALPDPPADLQEELPAGAQDGEAAGAEQQSPAVAEGGPFSSSSSASAASLAGYGDEILASVAVAVGAVITYFVIRYFLNRAADSLGLERGQLKGIYSITKLMLLLTVILVVIFQFSATSGVAAGAISVAAGTIIGFSSRNTISNAIAGILLLSARPFKIGDRIRTTESDELIGDVIEITILYTKLRTVKNELVAIPNQTLLQRQIVNYSGLDVLAAAVELAVTYDKDRRQVESIMADAASRTDGIIREPAPLVVMKRFHDYAAVYELRAFTDRPNEYLKIQSEMRKNLYDAFQAAGIDLTVPQAQSSVGGESKEDAAGARFRRQRQYQQRGKAEAE